jgi:hypothetical protein
METVRKRPHRKPPFGAYTNLVGGKVIRDPPSMDPVDPSKDLVQPQVAVALIAAQEKGKRLPQGFPPARMPALTNKRQKELSYGYQYQRLSNEFIAVAEPVQ